MPFGDWNHDGHVSPAEGWGTLMLTGVIEDGDVDGETDGEGPGDGGSSGGGGDDGCSTAGCGCMVALVLAVPLLCAIITAVVK